MEENHELLPPEQFQLEKPPCIRAALMEYVTYQIHQEFGERINEILDDFCKNARVDRPTAFIMAHDQLNRKLNPYRETAQKIMEPYRITLYNAMELEKQGEIAGAIALYEKLIEAGFTASMPYERLRIIYTKQKRYDKAIDTCTNFISTLRILESFNPSPRNLSSIAKYEEHVSKLTIKMSKVIEGKIIRE